MLDKTPMPSEEIYLLADHLDAALAAGEDLGAMSAIPEASEDEAAAISRFVRRSRALEAVLVSRILQARKRAQEARRVGGDMRSLLSLYVANSSGALDLIDAYGRRARELFETGDDPMSFLRSRGLIAEDAAMPESLAKLKVGDDYRIGGVVQLGPLLDLISAMLEALDVRYDLYADDRPDPVLPVPAAVSLEDVLSLARAATDDAMQTSPDKILAADVAAALADVREESAAAEAELAVTSAGGSDGKAQSGTREQEMTTAAVGATVDDTGQDGSDLDVTKEPTSLLAALEAAAEVPGNRIVRPNPA